MAESWVRLWAGMTTDPKFRVIARKSGRPLMEVLAVYTHLLLIANDADERGDITAADAELIAAALDAEEEDTQAILDAMQGRVITDGRLSGWETRQPVREDAGNDKTGAMSASERKRNQRERERQERESVESNNDVSHDVTACHDVSRDVTQCHDVSRDVTQCHAPEAEAESEAESEKPRGTEREVYTSRDVTMAGSVCARLKSECGILGNPSHPKLLALLSAGLTADEIVAAGRDSKGKGFAYVLATAEGRRRDASSVTPLPPSRASPPGRLSKAGQKTAEAASRWLESQGEAA